MDNLIRKHTARRTRLPRTGQLAGLGASLLLALSGCGGEDDDGGESAGGGSETPAPLEIELTEQGEEVELTAPETVPAGVVEIEFTNSGERPHVAQLLRVEGEHSEEEVIQGLGAAQSGEAFPEWLFAGGGVGEAEPGGSTSAVQSLEPGTYYIADATSRAALEGGGIAELEVTGEASEAELPEADATVVMDEYSFETEGLPAGGGTVEIENAGAEPHHVVAAPLAEGATIEDVAQFAMEQGQPDGPPPIDIQSTQDTAVLEGGTSQQVDLELEPGSYALLCFISDREGGPPHVADGMIAEATAE